MWLQLLGTASLDIFSFQGADAPTFSRMPFQLLNSKLKIAQTFAA